MILRSWPESDARGDLPLELHVETMVSSTGYIFLTVDVRRGTDRLTGETLERGHECRFQLGFWEVVEPSPVPPFRGIRRINAIDELVVRAIREDLRSGGYAVPDADLLSVLSKESMRKLADVLKVMKS